ncbi:unnamed protein product [Soboliphyme baturini]|uniref:Secreted protein n=1 Tax=Soboliphyme baturini TaxID=241478 RepID=A0A183IL21_9BILA|nr:unnamed protein product [Soboliphyme baturini]
MEMSVRFVVIVVVVVDGPGSVDPADCDSCTRLPADLPLTSHVATVRPTTGNKATNGGQGVALTKRFHKRGRGSGTPATGAATIVRLMICKLFRHTMLTMWHKSLQCTKPRPPSLHLMLMKMTKQ